MTDGGSPGRKMTAKGSALRLVRVLDNYEVGHETHMCCRCGGGDHSILFSVAML